MKIEIIDTPNTLGLNPEDIDKSYTTYEDLIIVEDPKDTNKTIPLLVIVHEHGYNDDTFLIDLVNYKLHYCSYFSLTVNEFEEDELTFSINGDKQYVFKVVDSIPQEQLIISKRINVNGN